MRGLYIPVCHTLRMLGRGVLHDSEYLYVVIITSSSNALMCQPFNLIATFFVCT